MSHLGVQGGELGGEGHTEGRAGGPVREIRPNTSKPSQQWEATCATGEAFWDSSGVGPLWVGTFRGQGSMGAVALAELK